MRGSPCRLLAPIPSPIEGASGADSAVEVATAAEAVSADAVATATQALILQLEAEGAVTATKVTVMNGADMEAGIHLTLLVVAVKVAMAAATMAVILATAAVTLMEVVTAATEAVTDPPPTAENHMCIAFTMSTEVLQLTIVTTDTSCAIDTLVPNVEDLPTATMAVTTDMLLTVCTIPETTMTLDLPPGNLKSTVEVATPDPIPLREKTDPAHPVAKEKLAPRFSISHKVFFLILVVTSTSKV